MSALLEYECPRCGGRLEFDASSQSLKCPFCDSVFTVQEIEDLFGGAVSDAEAPEETAQGGANA